MEQFVKDLVKKYEGKTPYEKLALTDSQKAAVSELEAAIRKCRSEHVAFVQSDYATYAINNEDVYDFDCEYHDYSCEDIDMSKLQRIDWNAYEKFDGTEECTVSFYSLTFPEGGEGIVY